MNIGEEKEAIVAEPVEDPFKKEDAPAEQEVNAPVIGADAPVEAEV